ncbi:hypothetical protein PISMIDRAFT_677512 [Pisolithus microcarpus 441]|uniref:Uncharacterized protein n=1 Tax=Pisolithus microcarpus 441 TaxID=765257 RepID=A0A0C9YJW2_9AGAM|nr:hypothetical protein PISMIDRAFT_677512 [Pisolithus microcarpus 441]
MLPASHGRTLSPLPRDPFLIRYERWQVWNPVLQRAPGNVVASGAASISTRVKGRASGPDDVV